MKNLLYLTFLIFFCYKSFLSANTRYICEHGNKDSVLYTTNFYLSAGNIIMSGAGGQGKYKIVNYKPEEGVIAINISKIGDTSGIEVIFIDFKRLNFTLSSKISDAKNNIKITGHCKSSN